MRHFVYVMVGEQRPLKIGFSRYPEERKSVLQAMEGRPLHIAALWPFECSGAAYCVEQGAHRRLQGHRVDGEWFFASLDQATEAISASIEEEYQAPQSRQIAAFGKVVRRGGQGRTHAEIAEQREADSAARCKLIAPDWPKPKPPTRELLAKAGVKSGKPMARATAIKHLGPRPVAQRAYQIAQNRKAGRDAGATPGRKPKK